MKTTVIANPRAAAGRVGRVWDRYERAIRERFGDAYDVMMTRRPGGAVDLARQAVEGGAEQLVVVGGDGTIGEAVNGMFGDGAEERPGDLPTVTFLPAGTGGDFSRSLGLKGADPVEALAASSTRRIDVGRVEIRDSSDGKRVHHFINIASFGSSALIVDKVNNTSKALGGQASFLVGTLKGLYAWRDRRVRLRVDDHFDEELWINTVALANGRYFGGGMKIAPNALIDDGELHVIVIEKVGIAKFLRHSGKLYRGTHLEMDEITELKGKTIIAEPVDGDPAPLHIETDGETPGFLPVRCTVLPGALELDAPWDRAEAVS